MRFRYPGVRSFTREDGNLFFGRKNDEERLYKLIRLEKLVTLYGKSGYGKSSLLQAKILPRLEAETDFVALPIRFYGYNPKADKGMNPLERTIDSIQKWAAGFQSQTGDSGTWIDQLVSHENSLWYHIKKAQAQTGKTHFVIVFDQFEEVFTYPEADILQFKAQLADLLFVQIPQNFRNAFDAGNQLNEKETESFFNDVEARALFSVRSDYLHLLNRLKDFLPQILRHCYELDALSTDQAREAIIEPARFMFMANKQANNSEEEMSITPAFEYAEDSVQALLDFLSKNGKEKIESFNLQLVCRHIETKFVQERAVLRIRAEMFGADHASRNKYLQAVNQNYYQECIQKLPVELQNVARKIVETELVTVEDKRRIMADAGMLVSRYRNEGASTQLLDALQDTYLLRVESTPRGAAYELSHDALVEPILDARELREKKETKLQEEKRRRRNLAVVSVSVLVAIVSLGSMIGVIWQTRRAQKASAKSELSLRSKIQAELNEKGLRISIKIDESKFYSEKALEQSKALSGGGCTELEDAISSLVAAIKIDTTTVSAPIRTQLEVLRAQVAASNCPERDSLLLILIRY